MASIREQLEAREHDFLAPQAAKSASSRGRLRSEPEDPIRPVFQRDRDRIIHSKAFRRLKHKTQVFFAPTGDHYRTRLTHTLEVSQIARSIAKVLRLHEELTEAIALGHDLGPSPVRTRGRTRDRSAGAGRVFSLRTELAHRRCARKRPAGLEPDLRSSRRHCAALERETRHAVGAPPEHRSSTVEGQIARVADICAYVNHDIDDAVRAGILTESELPAAAVSVLGDSSSQRINTMVTDVVTRTLAGGLSEIRMSDETLQATLALRSFLFEAVYENPRATAEFQKASGILGGLWEKLRAKPEPYLDPATIEAEGLDAATRDFLAGMTDRYAVALFEEFFVPRSWSV
jgi:dGTPase